MKKFSIVILSVLLASCSALGPAPQPAALPTQVPPPTAIPPTAQVIVATVLVPVVETVVVTQVVTPAATSTEAAPVATAAGGPLALNDNLGGGFFTNMTYSASTLSLRCAVKTVTFSVKPVVPQIVNVDFWYRIEDKTDLEITEWKIGGAMTPDNEGGFSITFSAETMHPDLRRAQAWFDFQFVGLAKSYEAVGRTEKLVQLINYSNDCPK